MHDCRYRRIALVLKFLPSESSGVHGPRQESCERSFFERQLPVAVERDRDPNDGQSGSNM